MGRQLDETLREGLRAQAESLSFSEEQSSRVLNNIHNLNRRKITMMGKGKKILVAAAAIFVIGSLTVYGAGQVIGYRSSVNVNQVDYKNAQEVRKAEDKLGVVPKVPQHFLNGAAFQSGYFMMVDGVDEHDNIVKSYPSVSVNYDEGIFLDISPAGAQMSDEEIPAEKSRQSGGISLNAYATNHLFLPPDASPSADDLALEEDGKLQIGYGSAEEERKTYRYVTWNKDNLRYSLATFNENYELEELLDMAEEVLAVE